MRNDRIAARLTREDQSDLRTIADALVNPEAWPTVTVTDALKAALRFTALAARQGQAITK